MENKRYTPEEVLNLQSQAYQKGCNEGYELCKKQHPGIGWVKCSDRLPGYKKRVKWRDGNDHSYATDGKIFLFEMEKPNLEGCEWLDESAAGREQANRCPVYVPCAENDPDCCGAYTSNDGRSLCYVKEVMVPLSAFKQQKEK